MSKIRLHGSSSGYTEIAPVAASGNNTITLPNDGTIISKDSNGAVGVTSITVGTGIQLTSSGNIVSGGEIQALTRFESKSGSDLRLNAGSANRDVFLQVNDTTHCTIQGSTGNLQFNSGYGSVATAFGVRAWVSFNGTGTPAIRGDGGVSSVGDNDTGDFTVNFDNNMPDVNYAVGGLSENWEGTNSDSYTQISGYTGGAAVGSYRFVTLRSRFDQQPPERKDPPFVQLIFVR